MHSTVVDSAVSAETETEVESTSTVSSEVQQHSQNLPKVLVWSEKSLCGLKNTIRVITGIWWPDMIV